MLFVYLKRKTSDKNVMDNVNQNRADKKDWKLCKYVGHGES